MPTDPAVTNAQELRNELDGIHNELNSMRGGYRLSAWDTVAYGIRTGVLLAAVAAGVVGAYKGVNHVYDWLTRPKPVAQFPTDNYFRVAGFKKVSPTKARMVLLDVDDGVLLGRQSTRAVTEEDLLNGKYVAAADLRGVDLERAERAARVPGSAGTLSSREDFVSKAIGRFLADGSPAGTMLVEVEGDNLDRFDPLASSKPLYATSPSNVGANRVSSSPPGEEPFFRVPASGLELVD